jgi:hypothetical protein
MGHIPLPEWTKPNRTGDLGSAVNAGTMQSSRGKATAVPIPFSSVRRGSAFLKITI